jgi:hypothetical protein
MQPGKRGPGGEPPRQPEVPVIDDPQPSQPKPPDLPPPVPDPPDVVDRVYGYEWVGSSATAVAVHRRRRHVTRRADSWNDYFGFLIDR